MMISDSILKDAVIALHEVAAFLDNLALDKDADSPASPRPQRKRVNKIKVDIAKLAESVRLMKREELLNTLESLPTSSIRSLCYQLGIKGVSKRAKKDLIEIIVRELVDFDKQHQLLRTFSQLLIEENQTHNTA